MWNGLLYDPGRDDPKVGETIEDWSRAAKFEFKRHRDGEKGEFFDAYFRNDTGTYYIEYEKKCGWYSGLFPYPTVHISLRKENYFGDLDRNLAVFAVVSASYKQIVFLPAWEVYKASPITLYNLHCGDQIIPKETFYNVPVTQGIFHQKSEKGWILVKQ